MLKQPNKLSLLKVDFLHLKRMKTFILFGLGKEKRKFGWTNRKEQRMIKILNSFMKFVLKYRRNKKIGCKEIVSKNQWIKITLLRY